MNPRRNASIEPPEPEHPMKIVIGRSISFCCKKFFEQLTIPGGDYCIFHSGEIHPSEGWSSRKLSHCPFCGAQIVVVDPEENAKKIFRDAAGDPKDECIGGHVSNQDYSDTEPQRTFIVDEDDGYAD